MLTTRGWWLLMLAVTVTAIGGILTLRGNSAALLIGLTMLSWIAWEWVRFARQALLGVRRLRVRRTIRDLRTSVTTLWAGQGFAVQLGVSLGSSVKLGYVRLSDRVPVGADAEGQLDFAGPLTSKAPAAWSYRIHCRLPGTVRFEGVRIQLADLQGLFYFETFL